MAAPVFTDGRYVNSLKIDFGILDGPQYSIGGVQYVRIGAVPVQIFDHVGGSGDDVAKNTSASPGGVDFLG